MLFGVQGQLDHAFKKFVRLQLREIVSNELFAKQAADIAQLAALLLARIDEVPVTVVDDDHVFFLIES